MMHLLQNSVGIGTSQKAISAKAAQKVRAACVVAYLSLANAKSYIRYPGVGSKLYRHPWERLLDALV